MVSASVRSIVYDSIGVLGGCLMSLYCNEITSTIRHGLVQHEKLILKKISESICQSQKDRPVGLDLITVKFSCPEDQINM